VSISEIKSNIINSIGNTPIIKINKITQHLDHDFYGKIEYFNPGGSIKDRIALNIIEQAERRGELKPGGTLIEATSGNTGIGLAIVAAMKGYKCIFIMPDKISEEKRAMLRAYGAKVVITPTGLEPENPLSHYSVAATISKNTPNSYYTNQYHNPDNLSVHYHVTGPEIWRQMGGNIDVLVGGAGTGGTLSGAAQFLKEKNPKIKILCADPVGSILYDLFYHKKIVDPPAAYKVEGVGEDMLPDNVKLDLYSDFERVTDKEAFQMTRRLSTEEALCVGPSSALALVAAMKYSLKLKQRSKILVIFPDSGRSYLSKAFNDQWMVENGFLTSQEISQSFNVEVRAQEYLKL